MFELKLALLAQVHGVHRRLPLMGILAFAPLLFTADLRSVTAAGTEWQAVPGGRMVRLTLPGAPAIELGSNALSLSSRRGRRGLGRGGPSFLQSAPPVSIDGPLSPTLSPLVPRREREKTA